MNAERGLRELRLCETLSNVLDLSKRDFELIPLIRGEAVKLDLPNSERFAVQILLRIRRALGQWAYPLIEVAST